VDGGELLPFLWLGGLQEGEQDALVKSKLTINVIGVAFDVSPMLKQGGFDGGLEGGF